ncbi:sirohydrochlorin ferrochelatase [Albidovulum inexpectatum]|uniref:Sirohydrochlorin ferrochelatase n=1 Tax=Albidovulum inexpectatum TaxID=196587 RepID=A0A2S5JIA8_9RHOB|nr:CbiX/SirB N-terminal domain-containing protein [Albidovulum inexpectatum]PPB81203.1 sirohydrochlorin ferrochelatase [Albidovulum inexpectatum]
MRAIVHCQARAADYVPDMSSELLIVAHGQPSDPHPAEAEMNALAARVARRLPGWRVGAATLADPTALPRALDGLDDPFVLPLFMADGWFTQTALPRRLAKAGRPGLRILTPLGLMPELTELARDIVAQSLDALGWRAQDSTLLLAAHGSGRSRAPAAAARAIETALRTALPLRSIATGFIEESPRLVDAARNTDHKALCLPLFVARWGHVRDDVPDALSQAGFAGHLLDPIGLHPRIPEILAHAARQAVWDCTA